MDLEHIRLACIGCGRIAQNHLYAMSTLDNAEIVGVVDTQINIAKSVAEQFECKSYITPEDLVKNQDVDAVTICTPPSTHHQMTNFFLEHGIHVLCEKPLTLTAADSEDLVRKAEKMGVTFMMAAKFRYVNDVVKAKGIIESGILGSISFFENTFCSYVDMKNRWNSDRSLSGGGVLIDNGPHAIDLVRFLLGEIVNVQAIQGPQVQDVEVEDTIRMFFQTRAGVLGTIDLSWSLHKPVDDYIMIHGSEGSLSIGWPGSGYHVRNRQQRIEFGSGYNKREAFVKQHKHFIECITGQSIPIINMADGVRVMQIIEASYQSMEENHWVSV